MTDTAERVSADELYVSEHLNRALSSEVQVRTTQGTTFCTPLALARSALVLGESSATGLSFSLAFEHSDPKFEQPMAVKTVVTREGLFWVPRLIQFGVGSISKEIQIDREFNRTNKKLKAEIVRFGGQTHAIRQDGHENEVRRQLQGFLRELPGVVPLGG